MFIISISIKNNSNSVPKKSEIIDSHAFMYQPAPFIDRSDLLFDKAVNYRVRRDLFSD